MPILLLILSNLPTIIKVASGIVGGIEELQPILSQINWSDNGNGTVTASHPDPDSLQGLYDKYGPERTE